MWRNGIILVLALTAAGAANAASFARRSEALDVEQRENVASDEDVVEVEDEEEEEDEILALAANLRSKNIRSLDDLQHLKAKVAEAEKAGDEEPGEATKLVGRMARTLFDFANTNNGYLMTDQSRAGGLFNLNLDPNAIQEVVNELPAPQLRGVVKTDFLQFRALFLGHLQAGQHRHSRLAKLFQLRRLHFGLGRRRSPLLQHERPRSRVLLHKLWVSEKIRLTLLPSYGSWEMP